MPTAPSPAKRERVGVRAAALSVEVLSVALVIHLKKDQQIVLNGAVIENTSGRSISLSVKNEAAILRSSDILAPEDAATPASRAYYALQCVYLFPERAAALFTDLQRAC